VILRNSTASHRDEIRKLMQQNGIQTSVHYPAIHRFSAYKQFHGCLPNTEYISDNEITLPMYGQLTDEEVSYICDTLISLVNN
jgi:dTDP-4-amino-4,6-dideoxygalactose transaminase